MGEREITRKCIQCGKMFSISAEEQKTYMQKGYRLPKRCKSCRKNRRDEEAFVTDEITHLLVEEEIEKRRAERQSVKNKHLDRPLQHNVKTLFLIGNGFDIWCGLDTQYTDFETFYEQNKIQISWDLGIEPCELTNTEDHTAEQLTQFDLLYFVLSEDCCSEEGSLTDFWSDFENSLKDLDDVSINLYFGKEIEDLKDIRLDCDYAYEVMRKCFSEWVGSIDTEKISVKDKFLFGESLFVTFNYTDTLVRNFNVDGNDVIHIHGHADDTESIIFGHGKPIDADVFALSLGGRLAGAYMIATILKKFYKDPPAQWRVLQKRLRNKCADLKAVEDVYVLGHSLGTADKYYFQQLKKVLSPKTKWHISYFSDEDSKRAKKLMRELQITEYQLYPSIDLALARFKV